MTRPEIIELASKSGFLTNELGSYLISPYSFEDQDLYEELEAFAKVVTEKERDACAKIADKISDKYSIGYYGSEVDAIDEVADAIRARGETFEFEPCPFVECGCDGNHPKGQSVVLLRGKQND